MPKKVKVDSQEGNMFGVDVNPSPFALKALDNHLVLKKIISHLGDNPLDLIKYRSVCQNWNDEIVRKINKSGHSFKIPLRYGPALEKGIWITESEAEGPGREIMEDVTRTLTGTAARIHFNSVVVDRGFYLAGISSHWTQFLEIHGKSIQHLKFKIRREKCPTWTKCHVFDCEAIVSMDNLRAVFCSTPNLESLDFCIRFSNYMSRTCPSVRQRMFLDGDVPQLLKLKKMTIEEPHRFPYTLGLLREILSMAPNLTSLYIKPTTQMTTFCLAMKSLETQLTGTLTSFRISGALFQGSGFPYLSLTTLEIKHSFGAGKHKFVNKILRAQHFSLVTVILGNRGNTDPNYANDHLNNVLRFRFLDYQISFPRVMENLKSLEVNLNQFKLPRVTSYKIQFPALEHLALRACGGHHGLESTVKIMEALRPQDGPSQTLKDFYVFCRGLANRSKYLISMSARETFPTAVHHIGDHMVL